MAYDVSSWFIERLSQPVITNAVRKFYVNSQDLSDYVVQWPEVERKWDEVRAQTENIRLAAEDQTLNWLINSALSIRAQASVQWGLMTDSGTNELIDFLVGTLQSSRGSEGTITVSLVNKFKQLSERTIGTPSEPQEYINSSYLISDLAWYVVTSHGGYSAVQSNSNVDIDYASYEAWKSLLDSDNVRAKSKIDGKKCTELLGLIAKMTDSAIYEENGKIRFSRFTLAGSYSSIITTGNTLPSSVVRSDDKMINDFKVAANYDVDNDEFAITVNEVNSSSINDYGRIEELHDDTLIWYVDSISALNYAQRVINTYGDPELEISVMTTMHGMVRQIGEMITYSDSLLGLDSDLYRIFEYKMNLEDGTVEFLIRPSALSSPFILDVSILDGPDVLT